MLVLKQVLGGFPGVLKPLSQESDSFEMPLSDLSNFHGGSSPISLSKPWDVFISICVYFLKYYMPKMPKFWRFIGEILETGLYNHTFMMSLQHISPAHKTDI